MKTNRSLVTALALTLVLSIVYRILPNRPPGFAPQIAIALFGGALFTRNKQWAFLLPLASMFLSDLLYEIMYRNGLAAYPGFYHGQWVNYLLIAGLALFGFMVRSQKLSTVIVGALAAPTSYFLASNFMVWAGGGGWQRPKNLTGLLQCYTDAFPFYINSLMATAVFAAILFGGYTLLHSTTRQFDNSTI